MAITCLNYLKGSCPHCSQKVVLKNCKSELSYILANLYKFVSRYPVFQIGIRESSLAKTKGPVSLRPVSLLLVKSTNSQKWVRWSP